MNIQLEKIQRETRQKRSIRVSLVITKAASDFMREKNISPTKLFDEALTQVGFIETKDIKAKTK